MRSLVGGILDAVAGSPAKPPVPYAPTRATFQGAVSAASTSPSQQQVAAMGSTGTLFSIVARITENLAQVNWRLYRTPKPGTPPEHRVEVTRHAALDLWGRPNPFMPRQEFVESFAQHLELTGEAWWVVSKSGNLPLELWPVRPDRMTPVPSTDRFLAGYTYRSPDGDKVPLDLDEVVFLRRPNPEDPYRGIGPVQSILTDIDSARYSAEWNRNFFVNSAEPGGIIMVDKRLSDDEFDEMTRRWRQQHQGVAQAHRVAVLEQGQWIDRKFSQRDMQFAELRNVSREILREAFGISKTMIGQTEDVNRATAQTAEVVFARWLLVPRLERIKQALNNDLLPMFGRTGVGVEFDYDSPIPVDEELEQTALTTRANAASVLVTAGWEPAAVLETVGLPPMPHTGASPTPGPAAVAAPPNSAPSEDDGQDDGTDQDAEDGNDDTSAGDAAARALLRILAEDQTLSARLRAALDPDRPTVVLPPPPLPDPPDDGTPPELPDGSGPDVEPVQKAWEAALTAAVALWLLHARGSDDDQAASRHGVAGYSGDLVEQVRDAVHAGDLLALTRLQVDTQAAGDAIGAHLVQVAEDAARHVVTEAAEQGVSIGTGAVDRAALQQTGQLAAATLGDGLRISAAREAARVWGPGVSADTVAAQVADQLQSLTAAQPEYVLGGALTGAQAAGREATMLAGPSAALYASEQNDRNTCGPCRAVDGRWVGNSDDPLMPWRELYPVRGYVSCLGGDRCRGQLVAIWRGGKDWKKWVEKEPVERGGAI